MFSWKAILHSFLLGVLASMTAQAVIEKYERLTSVLIVFGLMLLIQYDRFVLLILKKSLVATVAFFRWTGACIDSFFDWSASLLSSLTKTRVMRGVEWVFAGILLGVFKLIEGACKLIFSPIGVVFMVLYGLGWFIEFNHKKYPGYYAAAAQEEKCYCPTPANVTYRPAAIQPLRGQTGGILPADCDKSRAGYPVYSALDQFRTAPVTYSTVAAKGRRNGRATGYLPQQGRLGSGLDPYRRDYSDGYTGAVFSDNPR